MTDLSQDHATKDLLATLRDLYPYNHGICGTSAHHAIEAFEQHLPFTVTNYPSGSSLRGWSIPNGWDVKHAQIFHHQKLIYDCIENTPLGCAYLSPSFEGLISKETLLEHCA